MLTIRQAQSFEPDTVSGESGWNDMKPQNMNFLENDLVQGNVI
ncbi:MAG: hypothetical protein ACOC2H_04880 [Spirochaetota bacterium]